MEKNLTRPSTRPIRRLLVANRGEICTRIIATARELDLETFAVYSSGDSSHACEATHALCLSSTSSYMNIDELIGLVRKHNIDAVHPGYGFLSESDTFSWRMWNEANAVVIGPGGVPVVPGLDTATDDVQVIKDFSRQIGFPIMIKAVDGGGGRGIRLVEKPAELPNATMRAIKESPSHRVIAEKAIANGFRHVEVQIIGDGQGNVCHLWERECSIQRRYQKIVEFAPSLFKNRNLVDRIVQNAMTMAKKMNYFSLGTFEFLINEESNQSYFLEVNPRLQVEHTVTESISVIDIVKVQLLLSQGASLAEAGLLSRPNFEAPPPRIHSIQLRVTAEDVLKNWSLSIGNISSFQLPSGNGVRVDTNLRQNEPYVVTPDFDSLLAKIIVTASSWEDTIRKAKRALEDTAIVGIETNISALRAIVSHPDFAAGACDIRWLDSNQAEIRSFVSAASHTAAPDPIKPHSGSRMSVPKTSSPDRPVSHQGQHNDSTHILIPFPGKLLEILVSPNDIVDEDSIICIVQQMKIELEIRAPRAGRVVWIMDAEVGTTLTEGTLVAIVEPMQREKKL
ncbi:hypothetical protein N7474_001366 [Penicillium riverlandense]|uniref:uncharacterized protein n=1 Tax=Penicillium riverlandense TaxID=1903569 RepID=UPI0025469FC2|nr:uncharacterized protein N7474_001366 [Penicillium riverlandense]KAJ5833055.1 hypothetical protein N7474_001366 [Penicillium riverlandense]